MVINYNSRSNIISSSGRRRSSSSNSERRLVTSSWEFRAEPTRTAADGSTTLPVRSRPGYRTPSKFRAPMFLATRPAGRLTWMESIFASGTSTALRTSRDGARCIGGKWGGGGGHGSHGGRGVDGERCNECIRSRRGPRQVNHIFFS